MAFLPDFLEFCRNYQLLFIQRQLSQPHKSEAKKNLEEFTKEILGKYFNVVRSKILAYETCGDTIKGLEVVHVNLLNINSQLPDLFIYASTKRETVLGRIGNLKIA